MLRTVLAILVVSPRGARLLAAASGGRETARLSSTQCLLRPDRRTVAGHHQRFMPRYEQETGRAWFSASARGSCSRRRGRDRRPGSRRGDAGSLVRYRRDSEKGLIQQGWEERLPHQSLPYFSTIVFVVRRAIPARSRTGRPGAPGVR